MAIQTKTKSLPKRYKENKPPPKETIHQALEIRRKVAEQVKPDKTEKPESAMDKNPAKIKFPRQLGI